ncbi:MAG TPA: 2-oxoglutarate dehydrogenase complex dihydrolipoyllysine-residue succinyltransferase [Tepidisphaeraceae bacterium]|nr:2-oxoglutarate dehydrogenase complex dihydrolipoyllysine-residue succinyltransferase [Tepidisphaeraceae bacterium]
MPTNVDVPALGESVREAVLIKWHKNDGDAVAAADPIAELETDKANVDVPAPSAGVFKRGVKEGETVAVGATIGQIYAKGEAGAPSNGAGAGGAATAKAAAPAAPAATKPQASTAPAAGGGGGSGSSGGVKPEDFRPSVRRIVEEKQINPNHLQGTGPGGMVTKEDALRAAGTAGVNAADQAQREATAAEAPSPAGKASPAAAAPTAPPPPSGISKAMGEIGDFGPDGTKRVPMSKIRKKIAERLVEAQQTAAILTTFNEVDMTAIMDMRAKFKERFEKTYGVGLGFMSFFARAVVLALREFPRVNAQIDGDNILYHNYVHLGIAVSTERGLAVPVLRHVEQMGFARIESEIKRLALATREGKLGLQELSGGTFTITNGGVFGSLLSTPIINPPQSGILGMHAIQKRPVAVGDKVEVHPMMYIALSYDHRLVDGRESVSFLVRLKEFLEDPARLMLEI